MISLTETPAFGAVDGSSAKTGPRRVTDIVMEEAEMLAFARRYDPQPFHTDPAIGAASGQGRVTVCLGAGLALGGSKVTR